MDTYQLPGSFSLGFAHPFVGIDHLVTMVAVGIWAVRLGRQALWLMPSVFLLGVSIGGVLGLTGLTSGAPEIGVLGSTLALGAIVVLRPRATIFTACMCAGLAAIFHGHVHGTEIPAGAVATTYIAGFVSATAVLHACGVVVMCLARSAAGDRVFEPLPLTLKETFPKS